MSARKTVLVFRTGHLGDTVCAIPAFRLIRSHFPAAELTLVCDEPDNKVNVSTMEVIQNLGLFDRVITYTSRQGLFTPWQLNRAVRAVRPCAVILLPQVRESVWSVRRKRLLLLSCGVYDVRGLQLPVSDHDWYPAEPIRLIRILNAIGLCGEKPAYDIPIDETRSASVVEKLHSAGVRSGQPLIVFCGGGKAPTQCWPLDRYAAVLASLATQTEWEVLGIGNQQEVESYRVHVLPRFPALRLAPVLFTVSEIFELCRGAALYFGNDTGPMHVSAAVGCPVAVVMNARNAPGMWDPDVEPRLIIRHRTACEGCFLTDCIVEQHRCMAEITVDRVIAEMIPFMKSLTA